MKCPTPRKSRFTNKWSANKELEVCWRTMRGTHMPTRAYRCRCGYWHMTHKPKRSTT